MEGHRAAQVARGRPGVVRQVAQHRVVLTVLDVELLARAPTSFGSSGLRSGAMTILVHHLELSRSLRVLWLLEELGLPYEMREWKRDNAFRAPAEATKIHPLGRFPMVEVDGRVLVESGAILEYFGEREHKLVPQSEEERLRHRFFMHYAEGSAMPPLLVQLILDKMKSAKLPFLIKPIVKGVAARVEKGYSMPEMERHFGFIDAELSKRPYFAGDTFTLADIQMAYPIEAGIARGAGTRPNIEAWRARVTQREAYQRAREKGGPVVITRA
jgi:glutathione S-transferase